MPRIFIPPETPGAESSAADLNSFDKQKVAAIKSPNLAKMYKIQRPNACYFYRRNGKYLKALKEFAKMDEEQTKLEAERWARYEEITARNNTLECIRHNNLKCGDCFFATHGNASCSYTHCAHKEVLINAITLSREACEYFKPKLIK